MLSYISVTCYLPQTCWFSLCVPSVCLHVKDLQNHHSDCKITLAPCNLLFIAWQIVCNRLITVWNHLTWEGTHAHCNTDTQVNGNSCWHSHGKCLSLCPGSVPYGWIWLGREKSRRPADQWMNRNTDTVPKNMLQFGWPNVCSVCKCQIQKINVHTSWIIQQNLIEVGNATHC